jgi:SAM-dependent methyltransferase
MPGQPEGKSMDPRRVLERPRAYQFFQEFGGFFGARLRAIDAYLAIPSGSRIFDIGCGAGHIVQRLPGNVTYHGFDIDKNYIDLANRHFGDRGTFHCRPFDETVVAELGQADIVMMNGVLHHMDDEAVLHMLRVVAYALAPGGVLFTLDGCFRAGQSAIAKWLLEHDRGKFVRTELGYRSLLGQIFPTVESHIREDISWCPHTFIINLCRNPRPGGT